MEVQQKSFQELSKFIDDLRYEIKHRWEKDITPTIGKDR